MKKQPQTREEKIQFLKDMLKGKASPKDIIDPVGGVLFIHNGKVFGYQTLETKVFFNEGEEVDYETFLAEQNMQPSHLVKFENFSTGK